MISFSRWQEAPDHISPVLAQFVATLHANNFDVSGFIKQVSNTAEAWPIEVARAKALILDVHKVEVSAHLHLEHNEALIARYQAASNVHELIDGRTNKVMLDAVDDMLSDDTWLAKICLERLVTNMTAVVLNARDDERRAEGLPLLEKRIAELIKKIKTVKVVS
jgi:hypothetical protein